MHRSSLTTKYYSGMEGPQGSLLESLKENKQLSMMPLRRSITGLATLFLATVALGQQWPDHLWDVDFAYLTEPVGKKLTIGTIYGSRSA